MKNNNVQTVINAALSIAVIVLIALQLFVPRDKKSSSNEVVSAKDSSGVQMVTMPIAYIDVDSLLMNYEFSKKANEKLLIQSEKSKSELQRKANKWQQEAMDFQKKLQAGAFLSQERAEAENNRLMKERQNLEELEAKLAENLMTEQAKLNQQLNDTLQAFIDDYVKTHPYQMIITNTMRDNVLYAEKQYNITAEVVEMLNSRYNVEK